ncbi:IS30 family transposase, partial [Vibrio vulnificus]|uniref:IS30 family transposase n=1 Tax=Vibrio vulnificus TaxID=672 RepID=UPI003ED937A9
CIQGEIDIVLGKHGTGGTVAIWELLMPYKEHVHTIKTDNGRVFAGHETIAKALEADMYFAHPYSSWERGVKENANWLLRRYVKKGTDLTTIKDNDIEFSVSRINYRPKKYLGVKQPATVFKELALAA